MVLLAAVLFFGRLLANSLSKKQPVSLRLSVSGGFAILALAGSAARYTAWGHPGFTSDGFLIVFREQADVQNAYSISDRTKRIESVYQTLVQTAERVQAPARAELDRLGAAYRPHYLVDMIEVKGRTDLLSAFAARPEVKEVILNPECPPVELRRDVGSVGGRRAGHGRGMEHCRRRRASGVGQGRHREGDRGRRSRHRRGLDPSGAAIQIPRLERKLGAARLQLVRPVGRIRPCRGTTTATAPTRWAWRLVMTGRATTSAWRPARSGSPAGTCATASAIPERTFPVWNFSSPRFRMGAIRSTTGGRTWRRTWSTIPGAAPRAKAAARIP